MGGRKLFIYKCHHPSSVHSVASKQAAKSQESQCEHPPAQETIDTDLVNPANDRYAALGVSLHYCLCLLVVLCVYILCLCLCCVPLCMYVTVFRSLCVCFIVCKCVILCVICVCLSVFVLVSLCVFMYLFLSVCVCLSLSLFSFSFTEIKRFEGKIPAGNANMMQKWRAEKWISVCFSLENNCYY